MELPAILYSISMFFHSGFYFTLTTIFLVFLFEGRRNKRYKIIFALLIAFLFGNAVKYIMNVERPCVENNTLPCPSTPSFPSLHALISFVVAAAFLDKPAFPIFLFYALFISFTRIYLGVHTFVDIAGSLSISPLIYYLSDSMFKRWVGNG